MVLCIYFPKNLLELWSFQLYWFIPIYLADFLTSDWPEPETAVYSRLRHNRYLGHHTPKWDWFGLWQFSLILNSLTYLEFADNVFLQTFIRTNFIHLDNTYTKDGRCPLHNFAVGNGCLVQWIFFWINVAIHVATSYCINLPHECAIIHIYVIIFNFVALKEELYHKFDHLKHQVCNGS